MFRTGVKSRWDLPDKRGETGSPELVGWFADEASSRQSEIGYGQVNMPSASNANENWLTFVNDLSG